MKVMYMTEKVSMLAEDTETVWNYCKYHIGDWVEMYTTDRVMMRRYEQFSQKYPDHCKLVREDKYSMTFTIDPKCMGIKPKVPRKGPTLTSEQKQVNKERLEKINRDNSENTKPGTVKMFRASFGK